MSTFTEEIIVELPSDLDWSTLALDQTQGFVLSRVAGKTKTSDLIAMTGLDEAQVRRIVTALVKMGALLLVDGEAAVPKANAAAKGKAKSPYENFVFNVSELNAPCDIDEKQKKRILFYYGNMDQWNHYALLGLKRSADDVQVKRGYFKSSKEFHPDAYFRRELGIYKEKIEAIFKGMKAAYEVLRKKETRTAYDATVGADSFSPEELAELRAIAAQTRSKEEEKKQVIARQARLDARKKELRLRRNPMLARIKKAIEMVTLAEAALENKKYSEASRQAAFALEFSRSHPTIASRAEPVLLAANAARARIVAATALGNILDEEQMQEAVDKVLHLAPKDADRLLDVVTMLKKINKPHDAIRSAQAATKLAPEKIKGWRELLLLSEHLEHWHTALKAIEAIARLEPDVSDHKQNLKRIKKLLR